MIITGKIVIGQSANEQGLALDALHLVREVVARGTGEHKVANVDGVVPVAPRPLTDFVGDGFVQVVERHVPYLRGVPSLIAAHHVDVVAYTCVGSFHTNVVVAGNDTLLQIVGCEAKSS